MYIYLARPIPAELAWRLQYHLDDAKRVSLNRTRLRAGFDEWDKLFEGIRPRYSTIYSGHKRVPDSIHQHSDRRMTGK